MLSPRKQPSQTRSNGSGLNSRWPAGVPPARHWIVTVLAGFAFLTASACHSGRPTGIETHRKDREQLVFERLTSTGIPERVALLFRQVPREMFVIEREREVANSDIQLTSGKDRINWAPSELAKLLIMSDVAQYNNVLVLGSMGGYLESLLRLTPAFITAVDGDCGYVSASRKAAERFLDLANVASKGALEYVCKPPFSLDKSLKPAGSSGEGFDRIIVPYSVDWIPGAWIELLRPSGRIVVVVGSPGFGRLMVGDLQSTGLVWRQGPDMKMPRLDSSGPNNLYTQFAGEYTEPLVWPVPAVAQPDGRTAAAQAVARAAEPSISVPADPRAATPTDSDDAANEDPAGLDDALKMLGGTTNKPGGKLEEAVPETEPLKLDARTEPAESAPGGTVSLVVGFQKSDAHVKVPKYPSAYIRLNGAPALGVADGTKIKVMEITRAEADSKGLGTSYYTDVPPIKGSIAIPAGSRPGRYPVEGTVFYFYCTSADDAGYCASRKQKVVFAIDVK